MRKVYPSLLWPNDPVFFELSVKDTIDLDLSLVFSAMDQWITEDLRSLLRKIPKDAQTTAFRQGIFQDFQEAPDLFDGLYKVAVHFYELKNMIKFAFERDFTMYNVMKRLEESEAIFKDLGDMRTRLDRANLNSFGLTTLRKVIRDLMTSDLFSAYETDLKNIKNQSTIKSMRLGLNLDEDLSPKEAIVLSLLDEPFKYTRPLKKVSRVLDYGLGELKRLPRRIFAPETVIPKENLNELEKVIEPAMKQLITFMDTFNNSVLDLFEPFRRELDFYRFGLALTKGLKAMGYPVAYPKITQDADINVQGLYNMNLAYRFKDTGERMVYNTLFIPKNKRMVVLTGANRGGKTTFTQALGQTYWLGMLGYPVGAKSANLRWVDGLFVHFPSEERDTVLYGRLGEECSRFSTLFSRMTKDSLMLMNESFSGTSHLESLTIAKSAMKALRVMEATCIFNTHLHELAGELFNQGVLDDESKEGLGYMNLVSGTKETPQSFLIVEGEPLGKSYAKEIAAKYGVSFSQLTRVTSGPNLNSEAISGPS